jgi:hypothetical protein
MRAKVYEGEAQEVCKECGRPLTKDEAEFLHMSTGGTFFDSDDLPEGHESLGWFPFGSACAKKVLKRGR